MNKKLDKCDYVSFETAKALKEAGYPQEASIWSYLSDGKTTCTYDESDCFCDAPHLWDAMKWLREEKKLFLEVTLWANMYGIGLFSPDEPTDNIFPWSVSSTRFPSYEEACDAGIKAACEWLKRQEVDTKR